MTWAIRITTGARLHFGLLDVAAPFGGCGMMIDRPETMVQVSEAAEFTFSQSDGSVDHRARATAIASRIAQRMGTASPLPAVHVRVLSAAPAHTGLGSGTQLSLAIAEGILRVDAGLISSAADGKSVPELSAQQREIWLDAADRGRRSAVGTYGYLHGGLIVEGFDPLGSTSSLNTLDERLVVPSDWRVAILLPATQSLAAICGDQEQAKFDALQTATSARRDSLKGLLSETLMPAIRTADFANFCAAATQYNYESGQLFADVQGGAYNGPTTTRLIAHLRSTGLAGVGQSSWGPGVFVWFPHESSAEAFRQSHNGVEYRVFIARPRSTGRQLDIIPMSNAL